MRKFIFLITGIVICLGIAALGYFWATDNIESLYTYRSPLNLAPPTPREALGEPATKRVIFVLVDGLRLDTSSKMEVMPALNSLRERGASATMHSRPTSYSMPSYTVLLTGAWQDMNGGSLMNLDFDQIEFFKQDDLISAIHRDGQKVAISGFIWFQKMVPQNAVDDFFYTPGEDRKADELVLENAMPWLESRTHSFVLIHLDQLDYAGHHEGGARDPRWDAAANRVDGLIGRIVEKIDLERDTLIILSDHGHIAKGGHGGQDAEVLLEPFIMIGKGVKPGDYGDIQMVDVAPTVAALLGTSIPAAAQGKVLEDMLILPETTLSNLPQAISDQQHALLESYFKVMGETPTWLPGEMIDSTIGNIRIDEIKARQLWMERLPRYFLVAVIFIVAGYTVVRKWKGKFAWFIAVALLYVVIFNIRYALLDGMTYSLSSIIGQTELILYCAITAGISFMITWLIILFGRKTFQLSPLSAAENSLGLSLTIMAMLLIPVLLHFAANGWAIERLLPLFTLQFVGVLSMIQTIFLAVLGILFCGVSALIAWLYQSSSK